MSKFSHLCLGENLTNKTQHDLMKMANANVGKKIQTNLDVKKTWCQKEPLVTFSSLAEFLTNLSEYKLV